MQFFYPNAGAFYPGIVETHARDSFRKSLRKINVTFFHDGANLTGDLAVIDDRVETILKLRHVFHGQIDIEPDGLQLAFFVSMHADMREEFEVADENVADGEGGVGDSQRLHVRLGHLYSFTPTSGVCQIRCWPPSTAIICPVTLAAARR